MTQLSLVLLLIIIYSFSLTNSVKLVYINNDFDISVCRLRKDTINAPTTEDDCSAGLYSTFMDDTWSTSWPWDMTDHSILEFEIFLYGKYWQFDMIRTRWHNVSDAADWPNTYIEYTNAQTDEITNVTYSNETFGFEDGYQIYTTGVPITVSTVKIHIEFNYNSSVTVGGDGDGVFMASIELWGTEKTLQPTTSPSTTQPSSQPSDMPSNQPTVQPTRNGLYEYKLSKDCCYLDGVGQYEIYQAYTIPDPLKYITLPQTDCCYAVGVSSWDLQFKDSQFILNMTCENGAMFDGTTVTPDDDSFCDLEGIRDTIGIPGDVGANVSWIGYTINMNDDPPFTCDCLAMHQEYEFYGNQSFICNDTNDNICAIDSSITGYVSVEVNNTIDYHNNNCGCIFDFSYLEWNIDDNIGYYVIDNEFYEYIGWVNNYILTNGYQQECIMVKVTLCEIDDECIYETGDGITSELVDTGMSYFTMSAHGMETECYCYSMYNSCIYTTTAPVKTTKDVTTTGQYDTTQSATTDTSHTTTDVMHTTTAATHTTKSATETNIDTTKYEPPADDDTGEGYTFLVIVNILCVAAMAWM